MMTHKFEVSDGDAGERLEVFLSRQISTLSRRRARLMCEAGAVHVNSKRGFPGQRTFAGDVVELLESPEVTARRTLPNPEDLLKVLYEDEQILAVEKRPGMPSVTLRNDDPLTVADCVSAICADCLEASSDPREAGLVQRLDFWTGGIIVAAKTKTTWDYLHQQLKEKEVFKSYLALVEGIAKFKTKDVPLPLYAKTPERMEVWQGAEEALPKGKRLLQARSFVRTIRVDRKSKWSIVAVNGEGMRRHQIRVHLAAIGHPLWGDELYGSKRQLRELGLEREGFLLHASRLEITHPGDGSLVQIESRSPEMARFLG